MKPVRYLRPSGQIETRYEETWWEAHAPTSSGLAGAGAFVVTILAAVLFFWALRS